MKERPVAHLTEDGRVHELEEHLCKTAELAASFAAEFGCAGWGQLAGWWHDLGKFSLQFQRYILENGPGTDHSTAGALHAVRRFGKLGRVVAYLIAGHHAGLPDWLDEAEQCATLAHRLTRTELLEFLEGEGGGCCYRKDYLSRSSDERFELLTRDSNC